MSSDKMSRGEHRHCVDNFTFTAQATFGPGVKSERSDSGFCSDDSLESISMPAGNTPLCRAALTPAS